MLYTIKLDKETLQNRLFYSSIAHAISLSKYPSLSYEQSWDGSNLSIQNGAVSRRTISFSDKLIVGVFRTDSRANRNKTTAISYVKDASSQLISFAEKETFQYVLDNINGIVRPVITAAFFGGNEAIYSNDSLPEFEKRTDHLIDFGFFCDEENKNDWHEKYDFSSDELVALRLLPIEKCQPKRRN